MKKTFTWRQMWFKNHSEIHSWIYSIYRTKWEFGALINVPYLSTYVDAVPRMNTVLLLGLNPFRYPCCLFISAYSRSSTLINVIRSWLQLCFVHPVAHHGAAGETRGSSSKHWRGSQALLLPASKSCSSYSASPASSCSCSKWTRWRRLIANYSANATAGPGVKERAAGCLKSRPITQTWSLILTLSSTSERMFW